jgi:hypothetical protein
MVKMLAMIMLVYNIGLMLGEAFREGLYGHPDPDQRWQIKPPKGKCCDYSGRFVLLKQAITLPDMKISCLGDEVLRGFKIMIRG